MMVQTTSHFFLLIVFTAAAAPAQPLPADSVRGEKLFELERCIECHSVNGKGAHTAPDLGRSLDRDFSPASLTSTMWNHAPTMWSAMRARNMQASNVDDQAAADLFAYFYAARFFEKPGDAGRGKRLFTERSCARCHGLTEAVLTDIKPDIKPAAKPVNQWQALGDPIALTEAMWNHSSSMGFAELRRGIKLPELSGQDVTDILVYLRNLNAANAIARTFRITSGANGKSLFETKGCAACHRTGESAITWRLTGKTLTDIAARSWDHGLRNPAATVHLEPGEMREIVSYVWAQQFFQSSGDAERGKRAFSAKHCASCHDEGLKGAPSLARNTRDASEVTMVSALWRHGPTMLALMSERKIPWPRFNAKEMSDLIAYLNIRKPNEQLRK